MSRPSPSPDDGPRPGNEADDDPLVRRFRELLAAGRTEECIALLRPLALEYPDRKPIVAALAVLLQGAGRLEEAAEWYGRIVSFHPDDSDAIRQLADCCFYLGRRREAFQWYRRLEGTPHLEDHFTRIRMAQCEFVPRRLARRLGTLAGRIARRLLEPRALRELAHEVAGLPRAGYALRNQGLGAYLTYLNQGYLEEASYRHPRRACDACGSRRQRPVFFHSHRKIVECRDCGLLFAQRQAPDLEAVQTGIWEEAGGMAYLEEIWSDQATVEFRYRQIREVFAAAGESLTPGRLLEIGCAHGYLLAHLARKGMTVEGIEPSRPLARFARERLGLPVQCATLGACETPQQSFDYVLAYHVCEHLDRPSLLFAQAHGALRAGGFLLVETPAADLLRLPLRLQMDDAYGFANRGHEFFFTEESLSGYFTRFNFELLHARHHPEVELCSSLILGRKR